MSARFAAVVAPVAASLLMLACGASRPEAPATVTSTASAGDAHEASATAMELWRTRCNQCHVRVEPQTRERATLTAALERHKKRARLTESDVQGLVDYLAK